MSLNKNIPRWIFASIAKHFTDRRDNIHMLVEGEDRQTAELEKYFELRVDGPFLVELSKNYHRIDVEINILCTSKQDVQDNYMIHRLVGIINTAFTRTINCYKYGTGEEDDQSLFLCLQLRTDHKEHTAISHFGQIEPDAKIRQATVEGHYRGHLHVQS